MLRRIKVVYLILNLYYINNFNTGHQFYLQTTQYMSINSTPQHQIVHSSQMNHPNHAHTPLSKHNSQNYKYFSEKNIRKHFLQSQNKIQSPQQPFYLKLSNNITHKLKNKSDNKPQLVNVVKMKHLLNDNYSSQIKYKNEQRKLSQRRKIMEEKDYLSHFQKHQDFQIRREKRLKSEYNKDIKAEITNKQIILDSIKTEQLKQDRNRQPRHSSLMHKAQSFRNFYEQAYRYRENAARQYQNYMKQQRKYQDKRNKEQLLNLSSACRQFTKHKQFQEQIRRYQQETLRKVLETQIGVKELNSKQQKNSNRQQIYDRSGAYHPIINPIDYKINVENKYVIKQIGKAQFRQ